MFDVSFGELVLLMLVAVIFIRPKDVPVVIRSVAMVIKYFRDLGAEIKQVFDDIAKEAGVDDIKSKLDAEIELIKGDDGKFYESYKMPDILPDNNKDNHDVKKDD